MTRRDPLDDARAGRSELENHYIDELVAGRLDRRAFLRRGAAAGLSATALGAILAACGGANKTGAAARHAHVTATNQAAGRPGGGNLKLAIQTPAGEINPLTIADPGGLCLIGQTAEFLTFSNPAHRLEPMLATRWRPSANGRVWTFQIRRGVRFHDGRTLSADDVVYTFKQLSDPKNASNALSNLGGVLSPGGVRRVDAHTVAFHLDTPYGDFPYLVSSDNYNAIIVPAGTDYAHYARTFPGTGPFRIERYAQGQSASFTPNHDYWGGAPKLDGTTFQFYESQQPQLLALQGHEVDVVVLLAAQGAEAVLGSAEFQVIQLKSSVHRELSMRCDRAPFDDPRVREAIALSLDRPAMVSGLLQKLGQLGNDSPFAPSDRATDRHVAQRAQNVARAKQLLAAAGHRDGFTTTLATEQYAEIPQLAQVIAQAASRIGVTIKLKVETQSAYYGKSSYGNSDWLDSTMSLVDYGDRAIPNVFLESTLTARGPWNAAHFRSSRYDAFVRQYVSTLDLSSQRAIAGRIERLLLEQTPLVIPYWLDSLTATASGVRGIVAAANGGIFLKSATVKT